jgi:hypothetical protein
MSATPDAGLKRRIRNSALTFGGIALALYFAFIVMSLVRGAH